MQDWKNEGYEVLSYSNSEACEAAVMAYAGKLDKTKLSPHKFVFLDTSEECPCHIEFFIATNGGWMVDNGFEGGVRSNGSWLEATTRLLWSNYLSVA